MGTKVVGDL